MNIQTKELRQKIEHGDALQIIDVRSPGEYASGHIPCAVNLPLEQVEARLEDLNRREPIVLVCQSGSRAAICLDRLRDHRDEVILLEGGTSAWEAEGLPLIRSTSVRWSIERQVRLAAGLLVLLGTVLSLTVSASWVFLAMFVGAGLTFAGLTNFCGMASLFALMPWNKPSASLGSPQEGVNS